MANAENANLGFNDKKKTDLTQGPITEHIKAMALPASIGLFFQAMYNVTDAYYVGQLSVAALAGVSISFPIYFLMISIGSGLGIAANALTAKARGEKDAEGAKKLGTQAILFSIVLSVFASALGLATSDFVFRFMGAKGEVLTNAVLFMNMTYYGLVFYFLTMVLNGLLNSIGDTRTFGYVLVFGFFLNILLDPVFMYGWSGMPGMGVAGVAFATNITQLILTLALLFKVLKNDILEVLQIRPMLDSWRKLLFQAVPVSISQASVSIGFLLITKFVSDFGQNALAAFGIGTRIDQLVILPAIGIGIAVVSITGQNYGAKKFDRISEAYVLALKYSFWFLAVGVVAVFAFADRLAAIFTTDSAVISMTTYYLRLTAIGYISTAVIILSSSLLQGLTKAHLSLVLTVMRFFIISIPAIMVFAYFLNLREVGIWAAILFSSMLAAAFSYWYVRKQMAKL